MQALVRTSPDRLASRYGLLAGGANALLDLALFVTARSGIAALTVALSLLIVPVFVGSIVAALIGAALTMLGAALCHRRVRA